MSEVSKIITIDADDKDPIFLPEGFPLSIAEFEINGDDLVMIDPDGYQVVIDNYYATDNPPDLVSHDGAELSCAMVALLLKPSRLNLTDARSAHHSADEIMITGANDSVTATDNTEMENPPIEEIGGGGDIDFDPLIGIIGGTPVVDVKVTWVENLPDTPIENERDNIGVVAAPVEDIVDDGGPQRIVEAAIMEGINKAKIILALSDDDAIDGGVDDDILILSEGRDYLFSRAGCGAAMIDNESQEFSVFVQLFEHEISVNSTAEQAVLHKIRNTGAGADDHKTAGSTYGTIISGGTGIDVIRTPDGNAILSN